MRYHFTDQIMIALSRVCHFVNFTLIFNFLDKQKKMFHCGKDSDVGYPEMERGTRLMDEGSSDEKCRDRDC